MQRFRAALVVLGAFAFGACGSSSGTAAKPDAGDIDGALPPVDAPVDTAQDIVSDDTGAPDAGTALPAFPGARGWAAATPGGPKIATRITSASTPSNSAATAAATIRPGFKSMWRISPRRRAHGNRPNG